MFPSVDDCKVMRFLGACFAQQNALLLRTTAIRGGSDTLRIFRSGMDAAGLNRSDVSASTETRRQKRTRKYAFDSATKQTACIFSKGDGNGVL